MRINYKTYPILEKLDQGKTGVMTINPLDEKYFQSKHLKEYVDSFVKYIPKFRKELIYVSEPFGDAVQKAELKLRDLYKSIMVDSKEDFYMSGTYLFKETVFMMYCDTKKDSEVIDMAVFGFRKNGVPLYYCINVYPNDKDTDDSVRGWVSNDIDCKGLDIEQYLSIVAYYVFCVELFRKYATVETKIINPKEKIVIGYQKHLNETKRKVTYLDSKWFTNIVRSDGFAVRGHFRLQPKKLDGSWTKELIWINDFKKEGYTSKAKVLLNKILS